MVFSSPRFLMLAGVAWLSAEFVLLGKYSFIYTGDNATALVPGLWNLKFTDAPIPLWNNFSTSGWDRIAVDPVGLINHILFSMLPGWLAYQINVVGQICLAFVGTCFLANRTLKQDIIPSLVSAFVFASTLTGQLHLASVALLPALLVTITLVLGDRKSTKYWLLLGGMTVLLSHTAWISELLPFTSAAVVTWFLFVDRRRRASDWVIVLVPTIAIILLRVPEIIALMQYAPYSNRSHLGEVPRLLQWPKSFESSGSIAAILLVAYAIAASKVTFRDVRGLLAAIAFWTVLPYCVAVFHEDLVALIPEFAGYSYFSRTSDIPRVMIAVCAGYGIQALSETARSADKSGWVPKLILLFAAISLLIPSLQNKKVAAIAWVSQGNMVLNYESPEIEDLARRLPADSIWPVRVEPFQMYPAYLHTYGIESLGGLNGLFSARYHAYWGATLEPSRGKGGKASVLGALRWTARENGRPPLFRGTMLTLTSGSHAPERRVGDLFQLNLLSLANAGYVISRDRLNHPSLDQVRGPATAWSSLSQSQKIRRMVADNFHGRRNLYIYRNRDVLPRFFAMNSVRLFNDTDSLLQALAKASMEELRTSMFVEDRDWPREGVDAQAFAEADVWIDHYESDRIKLSVNGRGPTLLFGSNSYSPFWTVSADGRAVKIFPANHAFWGLVLPPGTKTVVFEYRPPYATFIPDWLRFSADP